jgi:hypothetical protein
MPSVVQLVYGTRGFMTTFTGARHWTPHEATWVQSNHPISLRQILRLCAYLRPDLPNGLFPSDFLSNVMYTFLVPPLHAECPAHIILFRVHFQFHRQCQVRGCVAFPTSMCVTPLAGNLTEKTSRVFNGFDSQLHVCSEHSLVEPCNGDATIYVTTRWRRSLERGLRLCNFDARGC